MSGRHAASPNPDAEVNLEAPGCPRCGGSHLQCVSTRPPCFCVQGWAHQGHGNFSKIVDQKDFFGGLPHLRPTRRDPLTPTLALALALTLTLLLTRGVQAEPQPWP